MCTPAAGHEGSSFFLNSVRIDGRPVTADEKTFGLHRPGDKLLFAFPINALQRISDAKNAGLLDSSGSLVKKEAPKAAPQPVVSSRPSSSTGEGKIARTAAPKGTGAGKYSLVSGGVDGANVGRKTLLGA
jgi:hypothetical protein